MTQTGVLEFSTMRNQVKNLDQAIELFIFAQGIIAKDNEQMAKKEAIKVVKNHIATWQEAEQIKKEFPNEPLLVAMANNLQQTLPKPNLINKILSAIGI